jgi:hypothetical protein
MKTNGLIFFLFILNTLVIRAQEIPSATGNAPSKEFAGKKYPASVYEGDTIVMAYLHTFMVVEERVFKSAKDEKKYRKLVRDVKKAYPYAKLAGERLNNYNKMLEGKSEVEKKILMKEVEKSLKKEFRKDLENMTLSQGKILLKLIDRETGQTSFNLIKDFRGSVPAFFWQSLGSIFEVDLKTNYQPDGDDKEIENIVLLIQRGEL